MKYTVLLLYPDSIAEQYGEDTYLACVRAEEPEEAIKKAQLFGIADKKKIINL